VHSAGAPSASGHGEGGYGERAETYLRLLAESALRPPADGDTSRVRSAAEVLTDAGVLSEQTAAEIITELQTALRVRGKREVVASRSRLLGLRGFKPGNPAGQPGVAAEPWRVVPLGPPPAGSRLMALIRTTGRALAPAVLHFSPAIALLDEFPLTTLTVTDDLGTYYRLGFPDGSWAGSTWTGTISLHPAPPPPARRLEVIGPNGPVLRADLNTAPDGQVAPVTLLGPATQSPGERLLTRRAEGMLAALAHHASSGGPGPRLPDTEELAATLEAAGLLSPLSAAPARIAALGQLLGLAAEGPAGEVPARWTAVAAYYGRRRRPAPVTGTAAIGVVLPELDGARFAVGGLHSAVPGSVLHVVAEGVRLRGRRGVPGRRPGGSSVIWDPAHIDAGFSWWVRDDAGGWHLGAIEEVNPAGGREGLLRMALLPPLGHPTSSLALEVSGLTQQVTATLPLRW
jgi:hypothetical protein